MPILKKEELYFFKIKHCPFCKSYVTSFYTEYSERLKDYDYLIECIRCGYTVRGDTKEEALEIWHRLYRNSEDLPEEKEIPF